MLLGSPRNRNEGSLPHGSPLNEGGVPRPEIGEGGAAQGKKGCLIDVCVRTDKEIRRRSAEATGEGNRKDTLNVAWASREQDGEPMHARSWKSTLYTVGSFAPA